MRARRLITATASFSTLAVVLFLPQSASSEPATPPGAEPSAAPATPSETLATVQELFSLKPQVPSSPNARSASPATGGRVDVTLALRDLSRVLPELTPSERATAEQFFLRPSSAGGDGIHPGYRVAPEPADCGPDICVHHVATTSDRATPAQVTDTKQIAETSWRRIVTRGGYRAPRSDVDSDNNGGDGRLDIYLADLGARGLFGYCTSDDPRLGQTFRFSAYCVVDNDFAEFGTSQTPLDFRRVTTTHEFFHAVQFAYDGFEDYWLMEGTAAWVEDEIHDDVNDNLFYLSRDWPNQLFFPQLSLDRGDSTTFPNYGAWLFWRNLSEAMPGKRGSGLPAVIRDVWDRARNLRPPGASTRALEDVLEARGRSLAWAYRNFATDNRSPKASYEEGASSGYARSRLRSKDRFVLRPTRVSTGPQQRLLDHLTNRAVRLTPRNLPANTRLRLNLDLPDKVRVPSAAVVVHRTDGGRTVLRAKLNKRGTGVVRTAYGDDVRYVELILVNASSRIRNCYPEIPSPFTCGGRPLDDNQVYGFRATAVLR